MEDIKRFLNKDGQIEVWPAKLKNKIGVLDYLVTKFEMSKVYSEAEINSVIEKWSSFGDHVLLRRALIDYKFLIRDSSGREYMVDEDVFEAD